MPKPRPLLARLLDAPDLAHVVPRLQPEVLQRVIQACGLEDCAEVVALATPQQLGAVLDVDVWRLRTPHADETFDAERFGLWLAVLMQAGPEVAADKLGGLDIDLVIAGLSRHASIFDHAAISSYMTLDGQLVPGREPRGEATAEIGGYLIEAKRTSAWDAIVELLAHLEGERRPFFHRLMRGCVKLSNGAREADGFHDLLEDSDQHFFDLASDRAARREQQGYLTPPQARAFLQSARALRRDGGRPPRSPVADAYFRTIASPDAVDTTAPGEEQGAASPNLVDSPAPTDSDADAGVVEILRDAGVLTPPPTRALLGAAEEQPTRFRWIEEHLASNPAGAEELGYLANAIMAGCTVQDRPFTTREATDGAVAISNLGLENWPTGWPERDLVTAFQVGWAMLHHDVCVYAAHELIEVLAGLRCRDRDIHLRLEGLRLELTRHVRNGEPWRARKALEVLITLDAPAWAALLGLIDECPVMHAALEGSARRATRGIDPAAFEFIAENRQIGIVRQFLASLGSVLAQ